MGAKQPFYYKLYYVHACLRRYKSRKKRIRAYKPEWRATPTATQRLSGKQKIQKMFDTIPQILEFLDAFPEIDF